MGFFSDLGRTVEVFGQGVARGLAGGVASVGDFAVNAGYNWTTRNLVNQFRAEDNQLQSVNTNFADNASEAVTWTEAQNDWERGVMTSGQVVGEIGGFVAATVATGGVGGAAFGAARTGAAVTRTGSALATGGTWMGNTARFMNPLTSRTALGVEGAFGAYRGHQLYTLDQEAETNADTLAAGAGENALDAAAREQEFLNNVLTRQGDELRSIIEEINAGNLTESRETALRERIEDIRQERDLVNTLRTGDMDVEERGRQMQLLKDNYPDLDPGMALSSVVSPYTRSEEGGNLSRAFADGSAVAQAGPAPQPEDAPAGPDQSFKPITREIV